MATAVIKKQKCTNRCTEGSYRKKERKKKKRDEEIEKS